ncbi:AraC family transcriptional regulator [Nonomuraea sp. 3-1Str]|uniref:AraC family transcriptional regulator n=1 Tax=Nonomuraea sp. 3-1Str TaxID=2929801 RepID=UPI0028578722|nr:AraC family transcriptional regulator [Nonomuraea sp. 3-1Str]MDR8411054.1 AraC family transcriptional regulator [Nonomuraea sp. 3-1Str]
MTADDMSVPAAEMVIVGHFDRAPGYATRRPAGSPSWLVMWTQAGAGLGGQAGASFTAGPGDLVVLAAGAAQHYRVAPGAERWRFWWAHFQPRPSWPGWLGPYARAAGCHLVAGVPGALHERLDQAFRRALRDSRWLPPAGAVSVAASTAAAPSGTDAGVAAAGATVAGAAVAGSAAARELVLGAVEEVLVLATASARHPGEESGDGKGGDPRVGRALALIAAEPGAPHSVASLARAVALSPSRFAHLFTAETGTPPMRAVRQARVRHAARLLEATDMDVGQVAAASGFVSPFHFSRAFRQEYGLPPRAYRLSRQVPHTTEI